MRWWEKEQAFQSLIIVYLVWYILNLTPVRPPNKIIISFLLVSMLICYDFEQQTSYSPYSIITSTIVESRLIISVWTFLRLNLLLQRIQFSLKKITLSFSFPSPWKCFGRSIRSLDSTIPHWISRPHKILSIKRYFMVRNLL